MRRDRFFTLQLGIYGFGELFAQFHSHLIERVDVPDDTLSEYLVLIEGDERSQGLRCELLEQNRVRRSIAGKGLGTDQDL